MLSQQISGFRPHSLFSILRPARLLFAIVVAAVILTAGANDKIGSKPTETSKTKLLRPHMEKILELVNEASNGDGDPLLNRRDKREAGCRGYLQDCSIQIAYPCCTGLCCVSKRCEWSPSREARVESARQRTDSIAYPWNGQYKYSMRFQPIVPVFPKI